MGQVYTKILATLLPEKNVYNSANPRITFNDNVFAIPDNEASRG